MSTVDYIPLASKYRPARLEDLVNQDVIVRTFTNAISQNKVHHSFLFFGPYGCGKTSCARIVAASLNCDKGPTAKPCGKCRNCLDILEGRSLDVIEIDAASNRGIDEIRNLKKDALYAPTNGRYKVYIIDESHQLTGQAAEAMLKVLEEPPQSVKFILCTTERHKLTDTILSRCQDFRVQTVPWGLIAAHLKQICVKENITIDDGALKIIAKIARGHLRDALQKLDACILYSGTGEVTKDMSIKALGAIDDTVLFDFIDAILARKFADAVRIVQTLLGSGQSIEKTLDALTLHLETLMIIQLSDNTSGLITLTDEEKKRFLHQAQHAPRDLVDEMITYLVSIYRGLFYNTSPQILLEQFILKSIKCNYKLQAVAA